MKHKLGLVFVFSALIAGPAAAQEDASAFLAAADEAMGASDLNTLHIAGSGWYGPLGQNFAPDEHWARVSLQNYDLTIDYENSATREEIVLTQGNYPSRGGGFQPIAGERRTLSFVSGDDAWGQNPGGPMTAQPDQAEVRRFLIATSPHGFIRAAMEADDATVTDRYLVGDNRTVKVVGFTTMDKYRVTGEFGEDHLLQRVITWLPNPVMGDMQYEIRYEDYRDIGGGVMFPFHYHAHQGDQFMLPTNFARNWMDYRLTEAEANVDVDIEVPAEFAGAEVPPVNVASTALGDGVWLVGGGSHNSIAIEFNDFITVIEAPLDDARSYAVINETKRLIPNKPIRYLVNTHHHWDHLGGVRNFVAEGATIITHEANEEFYNNVVFATQSRSLNPDRLHLFPFATTGPTPLRIETMTDRHAISDGDRTLMLFHVPNLDHAATMLIAYLPEEGIVVNADLYSRPPQEGDPVPDTISDGMIQLYRTIERWDLEVTTHVPIHGNPGPHSVFERITAPAAMQTANAGGEGG
jgi:glyoxylase-like metal-dependent hydrolase (beta-lactamase superfamily II)